MISPSSDRGRTRLYVCGPMTGIAEFNFPAFNAAADRLRAAGYDVVNPAEFGSEDDWATCLKRDLGYVVQVDGLALLPGWADSRGARLETHVAHELGIALKDVEEWVSRAA